MSSTRNKRKRPENDPSAMGSGPRRRSRETRAAPVAAAPTEGKNEAPEENHQIGEPATKVPPKTAQSTLQESKTRTEESGDIAKSENSTIESGSKHSEKNGPKTQSGKNSAEFATGGSGPSQAELTPPKKPLHASETEKNSKSKDNSKKSVSDKDPKIRGLIHHRSQLLERIKLCRLAAERRLGEKEYVFAKKVKESEDITDEQELAAFRELTRRASQAAKKNKSDGDGAGEKRTSLSLRRGSSVGKRMNAALSSLAPGSNTTTLEGVPHTQIQPVTTQSKSAGKTPQTQNALPKSSSKSAFQTVPADKQKFPPIPSAVPPPQAVNKATSSSILPPNTKQAFSSDPTAKGRAPNSKGMKSVARQSSVSTMPLHTGATTAALPPNRLVAQKVHFPLAVGLRAKREMIQSRLNGLLEPKATELSRGKLSNKKKKPVLPINPQLKLPPRRKTHWDNVLEEMRWMATDFIEERKWKASAARMVATSIPGPGMSMISLPASRSKRPYSIETKNQTEAADLDKECKMETSNEAMDATTSKSLLPPKASTARNRIKKANIEAREYPKPSLEDLKSAKKTGKLISAMIFELGEATMDSGSFKHTDELSNKALDRFIETRAKILDGGQTDSGPPKKESKEEDNDKFAKGTDGDGMAQTKAAAQAGDRQEQIQEMSFDEITEFIDGLGKGSSKSRGKVSVKEMANAMKAEKFQFGGEQKHALEFIDKLWGSQLCGGAVLEGPPASGKTIGTSTLLWKHRFKGPQLVVCSPTSVLRWRFEMGRFEDIRVLTVGLTGGICCPSNTEIIEPEEGDVLICEYSTVDRALRAFDAENPLHSIVIDCRHPAAFFACNDHSDMQESRNEWYGRTELGTIPWWEKIADFLKRFETRRLLIQYSGADDGSITTAGMAAREQLEVLSLRAACIIGLKPFLSSTFSVQRKVMSWARQKGKEKIPDKTARVKRILNDAIDPVVFRMSKTLASLSDIEWDVRLCTMPESQRRSYDKCCSEVRGALARSLREYMDRDASFHSFHTILGALSRLRQQCFHSTGGRAISAACTKNRLGNPQTLFRPLISDCSVDRLDGVFWRKIKDSPAQPDTTLVLDMMRNSAKLRELASILIFDCGLRIYDKEQVCDFLEDCRKDSPALSSSSNDDPKKVAILAVLPEIQILVSIFLNSLGIQHDLLYRIPLHQADANDSDTSSGHQCDLDPSHLSALAYSEQQNSLTRFGFDSSGQTELGYFPSTNVIVSSPEQVSCWMCGLGLESAKFIVSVDEDWTCRGDFMLRRILSRSLGRIAAKGEAPELIQLVCDDTLEERVFGYRTVSDSKTSEKLGCRLDPTCFMRLPESNIAGIELYHGASEAPLAKFSPLPALSLLKLRNSLLSEVLISTEELPPRFLSGERVRFLPELTTADDGVKAAKCNDTAAEKSSEIAFVREYLFHEHMASVQNPILLFASDSRLCVLSRSSERHDNRPKDWSPCISTFPKNTMTRQDLCSLSCLFYFERQSSAYVWQPLVVSTGAVPLAQLPGPVGNAKAIPAEAMPGAATNSSSDLAEAWRKSGLGCKPDDMAKSLLFYGPQDDAVAYPGSKAVDTPGRHTPTKQNNSSSEVLPTKSSRFNAYANLYSSSWDGGLVRDGSQGTEGLVFFPPLFPQTHECSRITKSQLKAIISSTQDQSKNQPSSIPQFPDGTAQELSLETRGEKRKKESLLPGHSMTPTLKRIRTEEPVSMSQPEHVSQLPPPIDMSSDDLLDNLEGILDDDDDGSPFAPIDPPLGPLIPGSDPLLPDPEPNLQDNEIKGLVRDCKNGPSISPEDDVPIEELESVIMGLDEDFGLLGTGALPIIGENTETANYATVQGGGSAISDFLCDSPACDAEEVHSFMGGQVVEQLISMILFVKRRPGAVFSMDVHMKTHPIPVPSATGNLAGGGLFPFPAGASSHDGSAKDLNGHDGMKKLKKKVPSQASLPVNAALPRNEANPAHAMKSVPAHNVLHFTSGKDSQQHRLFASYSSRHYATGLSMFESESYQIAALKVKERIAESTCGRTTKEGTKSNESGHRYPPSAGDRSRAAIENDFSISMGCSPFIQHLKPNCTTGDAAKALASSQRSALKRSLIGPSRVDFGPFNGGFLALSSGMAGISPPRSRLGVSLPMGVKVPQTREHPRTTWTTIDDELLQDCATRFGMNWVIVARAMTGFLYVGQRTMMDDSNPQQTRPWAKSARQCRDRWQALARNRPALANEIRKSERVLRESAVMKPNAPPNADAVPARTYALGTEGIELQIPSVLSNLALKRGEGVKLDSQTPIESNGSASMEIETNLALSGAKGQQETSINGSGLPISPSSSRGFGAFSAAKTKKQFVPLTVPGVPSGSQPNQPVPSHASHMQSVEASVAAQWSSGRTEMWPLQILDCAEKYRASRPAPSTQRNVENPDTPQSQPGWVGPPRRQTSSSHSQRSRSQPPSVAREKTSFPAVPSNNSRTTSQRQATLTESPQRTSTAPTSASKAYVPPRKSDEKAKRK